VTAADHSATHPERPRFGGWRGTPLRIVVVIALFAGLGIALRGSWSRLGEIDWQLNPLAVAGAFAAMLIASTWAAFAWLFVARAFGARLALRPALRIYMTSNLGKYLPGKVLHAVARVYLVQQQGVPFAVASTGVAVDVLLHVAAALSIVALAVPTVVGTVADLDATLVTAIAACGTLVGFGLLHPRSLNAAFSIARRLLPTREFPPVTVGYATILRAFSLYLGLWALYAVGLYGCAAAVYPVDWTAVPLLGAGYALAYLVGTVVAILPAGAVVREGILTLVLAQVMPAPAALATSVLVRLVQMAAEGVCAAVCSRF